MRNLIAVLLFGTLLACGDKIIAVDAAPTMGTYTIPIKIKHELPITRPDYETSDCIISDKGMPYPKLVADNVVITVLSTGKTYTSAVTACNTSVVQQLPLDTEKVITEIHAHLYRGQGHQICRYVAIDDNLDFTVTPNFNSKQIAFGGCSN